MNIYSLSYSMRQVFVSLRRNLGLSLITAGMIAISLMAVGSFMLVAINLDQVIQNIETTLEISVFMYNDADTDLISRNLENNDDVLSYVFVTRDEGLKEFSDAMGNPEIMSELQGDNNPLPDVFRVRARQAEDVESLAADIRNMPGVEMANYGQETLNRLMDVTNWIRSLVLIISMMLAAGAVFLIITIIKLSVIARQDEIGIMKYLGASNWFVRFPFVVGGMIIGWFGTIIALLVVGFGYFNMVESLRFEALAFFMQPIVDLERLMPIFIAMLLLGTVVGGLGSFVSVRKFLKV